MISNSENQISLFDMAESNYIKEDPAIKQQETQIIDMQKNKVISTEEEFIKTEDDDIDIEHYLGEEVVVNYGGILYQGEVTRIYNDGNTINCVFDGRSTAFYKDLVYSNTQ